MGLAANTLDLLFVFTLYPVGCGVEIRAAASDHHYANGPQWHHQGLDAAWQY